jgi:2'-hydroxyisoflavone reductase
MRLLIIGGTKFIGRHLVDAALTSGHDVTVFHRGQTPPHRPGDVDEVLGDRDGGLGALGDRRWDVVVDTCGYVPRLVRDSATALAGRVDAYLYVSSISAYADVSRPGVDEAAALADPPPREVEEVTGETYGGLKTACERAAAAVLGDRLCTVRPGLVVGPHDPTDRFTYWPARVAAGGAVLAPGRPERPVQFIDARDLGSWMIALAERGRGGAYNAVGPAETLTMGRFLDVCCTVVATGAEVEWVDETFLLDAGIEPWSQLPLWLPDGGEAAGMMRASNRLAVAAGLAFRPLHETVADTLHWHAGRGRPTATGLSRAREADLLAAWRDRTAP